MAFTKVLGPGIHTLSNITSHNIHSSGIITAISFVGDGSGLTGVASTDNIVTGSAATFTGGVNINSDLDVDGHTNLDNVSISGVTTFSGGLTGTTANFSGDVTVGGVLTYEDVKNVDSVGLITARNGIDCNGDIDVDGHTELDHVNIAGVTTFSDNDIHFKNNGITSCRFDSNRGAFEFNHAGGLFWYKNGNLSNSSGATIFYSEFANQYKGLVIQAPWQGQTNAKNVTVMGSSNGRFNVQNNLNASENFSAYFQGGVHLGYYQSGTKLSTTTKGITVGTGVTIETNGQATFSGITTFSNNLHISDIKEIRFGNNYNSPSMFVSHDGSVGRIQSPSTGIFLGGPVISLKAGNLTERMLEAVHNGAVTLYYDSSNHSTAKLATTATGVTIDGTAVAGGLDITGTGYINNDSSTDFALALRNNSTSAFSTSEHIEGTTNRKLTPLMIRNGGATANTETYLGFDAGNTSKAQWNIGVKKTGALQGDFIFNTRTGSSTSAERLRITSAGRVGIGTNPATLLHIDDDSVDPYLRIGGSGRDCGIQLSANSNYTALRADGANRLFVNAGADSIRFSIGGTSSSNEKLRIQSNNRVGIGTAAVHRILHINDTVGGGIGVNGATSGIQFGLVSMAGGSYNAILSRAGSNDDHITGSTPGDLCLAPEKEGAFILGLSPHLGAMTTGLRIDRLRNYDIYFNSQIKINTGSPASPTERVRITSDGKVGIGEDAPQQKLHLHEDSSNGNFMVFTNSTTGATGNDGCLFGINSDEGGTIWNQENGYIRFGTSDTERLRINSDGTVTLGQVDSSSSSALHIRSVTSTETTLELSTKSNYNGSLPSAKISFTQQNGTEIARIKCDTHTGAANMADLGFWTNYGGLYERMRITRLGRVGIGTDNPSFFTHIQADGVVNDALKITARGSGQMVNIRNHSNVPSIVRFSNYLGNAFWDVQYNTDNSFQLDYGDGVKWKIESNGNINHYGTTFSQTNSNNTVISTTRSSSGVTMSMQAISNPVGRVGTTSNHSTELVAYNNPAITLTGSAEILAVTKSFVSKFGDYNQTFNTGGWSTNWNTVINPGSLGYNDTYLISAYWQQTGGGGNAGSPYLMQASFLFSSVSVNNTSGGNVEFIPFQTSHVGGGSHRLMFRMIPGGGHTTAGVQVKNASGFHASYGSINVKACRIADW